MNPYSQSRLRTFVGLLWWACGGYEYDQLGLWLGNIGRTLWHLVWYLPFRFGYVFRRGNCARCGIRFFVNAAGSVSGIVGEHYCPRCADEV